MHNFDWDDVRVFLAVVEADSVSLAAEHLEINQSTVSRRISALEAQLGVSLFDRARGSRWVLTAAGEQMCGAASLMLESANSITREVLRNNTEVSGHVTVTCPDHGSRFIVVPTLAELAREYAELKLSINVSHDPLDLTSREADVAVRYAVEVPEDVVARRICKVAVAIYGTQTLYERFQAGDDRLPVVSWFLADAVTEWQRSKLPNGNYAYRANRPAAILEMARLGAGVAAISCSEGERTEGLVRFEELGVLRAGYLWVISHTDLRSTARVRLVRDRLIAALETEKERIEFLS